MLQDAYSIMFKEYDDMLTVEDVSRILGVERHRIYELIKSNKILCIKPGKSYMIPKIRFIDYVLGRQTENV